MAKISGAAMLQNAKELEVGEMMLQIAKELEGVTYNLADKSVADQYITEVKLSFPALSQADEKKWLALFEQQFAKLPKDPKTKAAALPLKLKDVSLYFNPLVAQYVNNTKVLISIGFDNTLTYPIPEFVKNDFPNFIPKDNLNIGLGLILALKLRVAISKLSPLLANTIAANQSIYVDFYAMKSSSATNLAKNTNPFWHVFWSEAQLRANAVIFLVTSAWLSSDNCLLEFEEWQVAKNLKPPLAGYFFVINDDPYPPGTRKFSSFFKPKIEALVKTGRPCFVYNPLSIGYQKVAPAEVISSCDKWSAEIASLIAKSDYFVSGKLFGPGNVV